MVKVYAALRTELLNVTLTVLVQVLSRSVIFEPGYLCNSQRVHLSMHDELVEEAHLKQTVNGLDGSWLDGWIVWELLTKSPAMLLFTVTYLILWPIWKSNWRKKTYFNGSNTKFNLKNEENVIRPWLLISSFMSELSTVF